jgi:undecaprenyl-diphosphatase
MTLLQAIILGVIQGLTEFIPISSTAHLILAEKLMGLDARLTPEQTTAFIAVIQLGTLLAVISYFMRDIIKIIVGFIRGNLATLAGQGDSWARRDARLGWLIIVGSIPIGIVGLAARKIIEGKFTKNLYIIGASMIIWAILLLIAELTTRRKKTMEDLRIGDALVVGMAQVFSLIPGSSRSGTTITGAMFAGVTREAAARFSFLLSIPAVAASGLLELKQAIHFIHGIGTVNLAVATGVSGVVGYISIAFLLGYLRHHTTFLFIGYRLIVGGLILWLVFTKLLTP